jgi:MFS family permease
MNEAAVSDRRNRDDALKRAALALGAVCAAAFVGSMFLGNAVQQGLLGQLWGAPFAVVGVVVAYRQPRHPIGWILLATALVTIGTSDAGFYALARYRFGHGALPLGRPAAAVAGYWGLFILLLPLPILLFPDGELPRGRWRVVAWVYGLLAVVSFGNTTVANLALLNPHLPRLDSTGELAAVSGGGGPFVLVYLVTVVAWFVYTIRVNRHATGERSAQLKWVMSGGVVTVVGFIAGLALNSSSSAVLRLIAAIGFLCAFALPVSIGVAILRYRLYEIDRIVSRTLSYAAVSALLAVTFVGLVVLSTRVLPFSSTVGVAASTLAAAALFNPLRVRVQRVVDRRFNRSRYDAEATVNAFAARLRDAVDLDAVEADLLAAVTSAVQPEHATVWLREVSR